MIPCHWIEIQKANESLNLLKSNMHQKHVLNHISMNEIAKVLLRLWVEIKISLIQKDTMDRGAWIKIQKESNQEDSEGLKSRSIKKCKLAWERGTSGYICLPYVTILWCLSWKPPKGIGKIKLISSALEELSKLLKSWFPFLNLDYRQWLKFINLAFWNPNILKKPNKMISPKQSVLSKNKLFRDLCPPGSHQLLQLQLLPKIFYF